VSNRSTASYNIPLQNTKIIKRFWCVYSTAHVAQHSFSKTQNIKNVFGVNFAARVA